MGQLSETGRDSAHLRSGSTAIAEGLHDEYFNDRLQMTDSSFGIWHLHMNFLWATSDEPASSPKDNNKDPGIRVSDALSPTQHPLLAGGRRGGSGERHESIHHTRI